MSRAPKQPVTKLGKNCKCGVDKWLWQGARFRCVPCSRAAWKKRHPPKALRQRNLRMRYGLTLEAFDALLVQQQGRCDICAEPMAGKTDPHVDHCHTTKAVRSLLCMHCNRLLGGARDNAEILVSALDYLTRHHPTRFDS